MAGKLSEHVPPGTLSSIVAKTARRVKRLIRGAMELHIQDLRERGTLIPPPTAESEFVDLEQLPA